MTVRTCQHCVHFDDDPAAIEAAIPGLIMLGSAYASARGHAGLCQARGLFLDPMPAGECPHFDAADAADADLPPAPVRP